MVRELVTLRHANAIRLSIGTDQIGAGDLRFFAAVGGVRWNQKRFVVRTDHRAVALVEPLGGRTNFSCGWTTTIYTPLEHLHAIGQLLFLGQVHRLPVARTSKMGQAGAGNQAASQLVGMIKGREQFPLGCAVLALVVFELFVRYVVVRQGGQALAAVNGSMGQRVKRMKVAKQMELRFFYHG